MNRKYLGKNINNSKKKDNFLILDPIIRKKEQAKYTNLQESKYGIDIWNAYEFSYLDKQKSPRLAILEIIIPSKSAITIESKSMKIYLNSFFNKDFLNTSEVIKTIKNDLSNICKISVKVRINKTFAKKPSSISLIDNNNRITKPNKVYKFEAFRSLCPVTNQPDWAVIYIRSSGTMNIAWLNKYFLSFRNTGEFHELCIDKIFSKIVNEYKPDKFCVYGRFLRRGGIDINPMRANANEYMFLNFREDAQ